jgi:hypothetical protein
MQPMPPGEGGGSKGKGDFRVILPREEFAEGEGENNSEIGSGATLPLPREGQSPLAFTWGVAGYFR